MLADRVVAIDRGGIALDVPVALPRPRRRDSPPFAALAEEILAHVLGPGIRRLVGAVVDDSRVACLDEISIKLVGELI